MVASYWRAATHSQQLRLTTRPFYAHLHALHVSRKQQARSESYMRNLAKHAVSDRAHQSAHRGHSRVICDQEATQAGVIDEMQLLQPWHSSKDIPGGRHVAL